MESTAVSERRPSLFTPVNPLLRHPRGEMRKQERISERHHLWHLRRRRSATNGFLIATNTAAVAVVSRYIDDKLQLLCVSSVALCSFQSVHFDPSSQRKKEEETQFNRDPEFTSRREKKKASVPKALLILAQISIACKELLTSLKQAILIKARIINSDLRTT